MSDDKQKQLATDKSDKLESGADKPTLSNGDKEPVLQSGDDLALDALSQALSGGLAQDITGQSVTKSRSVKNTSVADDADREVAESDQLAETLASLQNLIERNANALQSTVDALKEKRESLRNVFDNDGTLNDAQDKVKEVAQEVKTRKSQLQADPQVTSLKVEIGELNEQKKETEETLSNHLVNYHQLTNSKSFDTSDGDQWEFNIKAKIKPRRKQKD